MPRKQIRCLRNWTMRNGSKRKSYKQHTLDFAHISLNRIDATGTSHSSDGDKTSFDVFGVSFSCRFHSRPGLIDSFRWKSNFLRDRRFIRRNDDEPFSTHCYGIATVIWRILIGFEYLVLICLSLSSRRRLFSLASEMPTGSLGKYKCTSSVNRQGQYWQNWFYRLNQ